MRDKNNADRDRSFRRNFGGVGFDRMHNRVDAGGSRDPGRQTHRQFGIQDGQVCIQLRRHDGHLPCT